MAKIRIHREGAWADWLRSYKVVIDGQTLGTISNGKTVEFDVPDGQHELQLKIDWCSSRPLQFNAGSAAPATFECRSAMRGLAIFFGLYYVVLKARDYITLRQA